MRKMKRYYLRIDGVTKWVEVSKKKWVEAERNAGFWPTVGNRDDPATGGFGGRGVQGKIVEEKD